VSTGVLTEIDEAKRALYCIGGSELPDPEFASVVWGALGAGINESDIISWADQYQNKRPGKTKDKIKRYNPSKTGAGTLFYIAKQNGYVRDSRQPIPKSKPRPKPKADNRDKQKQAEARATAQKILDNSQPATNENPYLKSKSLTSIEGLYQIDAKQFKRIAGYQPKSYGKKNKALDGVLLVAPVRELDGTLTSIELIDGAGNKSALKDGKKSGCAFHTSLTDKAQYVSEGVATSISCYQALPDQSHTAGLSNNGVKGTVEAIRAKDKDITIVTCADAKSGYPDQITAKASAEYNARMVMPWLPTSIHNKPDFDDIRKLYGSGAVTCMLKQAHPLGQAGTLTDNKRNSYISGLSWVYVDRVWQPLLKAMTQNVGERIDDPTTPLDHADIHPSGLWQWSGKKLLKAILFCNDDAIKSIDSLRALNTTKKKIKQAENGNIHDAQAFILGVIGRIGSVVKIITDNNKFIVQMAGGWHCDLTIPIGDYLPIMLYWIEQIISVQEYVGSKHKKFTPGESGQSGRYGNHIKLTRGANGFPIYTKEFLDAMSNPSEVIAIRLPQKSGKSSVIGKAFMQCDDIEIPAMAIVHRRKLVDDLTRRFERNLHYKDDRELIDGSQQSISCCLNSLEARKDLKAHFINSQKILIDEAEQVKRHSLGTGLKSRQREVYDLLTKELPGKELMIMDADLSDQGIEFWASLAGYTLDDVTVVTIDDDDHGFKADFFCHSATKKHGHKALEKALHLLEQGRRVAIACESKEKAKWFEKNIKAYLPDKEALAIHSDTFAKHCEGLSESASDYTDKFDCVIYNSAMGTGVSIEHATNKFEHVFFVGSGTVLIADDAIQMVRRFRDGKYFYFDIFVQSNRTGHRHWDWAYNSTDPLTNARHEHNFNESIEHAYFATNLYAALKQRKFKITELHTFADIEVIEVDITPEIEAMCAANDLPDHQARKIEINGPRDANELSMSRRYQCREKYGQVTPETAERFLTPFDLLRDQKLCAIARMEPGSPGRVLIELLLSKAVISLGDAKTIMGFIKTHFKALVRSGCLIRDWNSSGKLPAGDRPMKSIKRLLDEMFGIDSEPERDNAYKRLRLKEQEYQRTMMKHQELEIEWPVAPKSIEDQINDLREQDLTVRAIADQLGISKSQVGRCPKTVS